MKKLFGAALALALGLTCVGSLAACDNKPVEIPPISDEEAVNSAMSGLKAMYIDKYNNVETAKDYELVGQYPVQGEYCPIVWTVNVEEGVVVKEMDATKKTVTIDVNETTAVDIVYNLTASITYNDITATHTFTNLTVPAYVAVSFEGAHTLYMYQKTLGKTLYFKGEINSSEYCVTTENPAEAATVYIKMVNEGYTMVVNGKYLEVYKNDGGSIRPTFVNTPTGAWEYDPSLKVFTWTLEDKAYYLGAYNNYNTMGASATSYISGANADKVGESQFVVKAAKAVTPGTYKMYLKQAGLEGAPTLYFTGKLSGSYGATTRDVNEAADVVVGVTEGGNTLKVGDKYLELDSAHHIALVDTPTGAWVYDYTLGVFTWDIAGDAVYYLGTYGTYNTISASKISYISGANAEKIGVSQFVTQFEKCLTAGTYNFYLYQVNKGQALYFNGALSGSYGATTEDVSAAAKVTVAEVAGGLTLKVGDKYLELDSAHHLVLLDAPTGAWVYSNELKALTWKIGDDTYYLGTYGTYNTISASLISYISGDKAENVGKTQFVLRFEEV